MIKNALHNIGLAGTVEYGNNRQAQRRFAKLGN
jgi:hypothetical protein